MNKTNIKVLLFIFLSLLLYGYLIYEYMQCYSWVCYKTISNITIKYNICEIKEYNASRMSVFDFKDDVYKNYTINAAKEKK